MKKNQKKYKKKILKILKQNPKKTFNYKQLSKKLNLKTPAKQRIIAKLLPQIKKEGLIEEIKRGKFRLRQIKKVTKGVVDLSQKRMPVVYSEELDENIHVSNKHIHRALHNDIVEVSIFAKSRKNVLEGEITKVLKRYRPTFVGTIIRSETFAFCSVDNKLMPFDIFIPLKKLNKAKHGDKVIVKIYDWPAYAKNPIGKVLEILGQSGEHNTEMHAILAEFGLPNKFPKNVEIEAEKIAKKITKNDLKNRKDFRNTFTITIDPEDAKDFDDAISLRKISDNSYEIGIHIADVSNYVKENSVIDKEAKKRATSVYLVDRVVPMLPEAISNSICSLNEKTDKLTFSVVIVFDKNANIKKTWIGKTIINSNKRFNYNEVQKIIEQKKGQFKDEILILNDIAQKIRNKRFKTGAISFERGELFFEIDDKGRPLKVKYVKTKEANHLIEEFMLEANKKVAEKIGRPRPNHKKKTFIYRVHDAPDYDKLKQFKDFALKMGYEISLKSKKDTANSLNKLFSEIKGKPESDVIANFAIRSMSRAIYSIDNIGHYGLGFQYYTHFTSPIRRYPDLMVHRLLYSYLNGANSANDKYLEENCEHCSDMENKAMSAERSSKKYKAVEYMKKRMGQIFDGYISGITEWGIYVELFPCKIEGMILIRDIADDFFYFDEDSYTLNAHYSDKKFQIGDKVKIKVVRADLKKRQLDFQLINN